MNHRKNMFILIDGNNFLISNTLEIRKCIAVFCIWLMFLLLLLLEKLFYPQCTFNFVWLPFSLLLLLLVLL